MGGNTFIPTVRLGALDGHSKYCRSLKILVTVPSLSDENVFTSAKKDT